MRDYRLAWRRMEESVPDDHLSNSVSVEFSTTGIEIERLGLDDPGLTLKAKSRFLSAVDRTLGSLVDWVGSYAENNSAERRAATQARIKALSTYGEAAARAIDTDNLLGSAHIANLLTQTGRRFTNKKKVVEEAIADLRREPPTDEMSRSGPDEISENFSARFERYAEDASEKHLREKWGRVLAAEIRKPGTISFKSMRIVDELQPADALLFEEVCRWRANQTIIRSRMRSFSTEENMSLKATGLINLPSAAEQFYLSPENAKIGDKNIWLYPFNDIAIAVSYINPTESLRKMTPSSVFKSYIGKHPAIEVYSLTHSGIELSSILPDRTLENVIYIFNDAIKTFPGHDIYRMNLDADKFKEGLVQYRVAEHAPGAR